MACSAGLVPDPAVEAFAERAAAGTPEQPPVRGAPEGLQVPVQEAGKLRGGRDRPDGALVPSPIGWGQLTLTASLPRSLVPGLATAPHGCRAASNTARKAQRLPRRAPCRPSPALLS